MLTKLRKSWTGTCSKGAFVQVMLSHMLMDSARCSSNGRNVRPDILSVFQPSAGGLQTPAISPALAKPGGSAGVRTSGAVRLVRALSWARARHGDQQQWRANPKHRLPTERLGQPSTRTGPAVVVNAYAALASKAEPLQTPALQLARRYGANVFALVSVSPALFFRRGSVPHQLKADLRIWIRSAVAAVAPN